MEETHELTVERLADLHEVLIRCHEIGTYTRFVLTEARSGTFVEAEFGIDPQNFPTHLMSIVAGRRILRRWLEQSIEALRESAVNRARGAPA